MSDTIYLDNAATTRVTEDVFAEMQPYFCQHFGNASAKYYQLGAQARGAVLQARQRLATLINATQPVDEDHPSEVVFTSCATESNNWVIKAALQKEGKRHLITSSVEHHAVLETAQHLQKKGRCDLTVLQTDSLGRVNPDDLRDALRDDTALVSVMLANNEVGTLQPVQELATIAREKGVLFHTDAVQAVGKIPVDVKALGVDFLSLSGHKFHGPKGVGALYVRKGVRLDPFLDGGGQERGRRAGTTNVPGIVGLGKAAELAGARLEAEVSRQHALIEMLWEGLSAAIPKMIRNGDPANRLPNILNVRLQGAEGEAVLLRLDMYGIQVASGSACSTDSLEPSHVLLAMGIPQEDAHGSLRMSISHETTEADIRKMIEIMPKQVKMIRDMSVTWEG